MHQFEMRFFDMLDVVVLMRVHTANDDLAALREASAERRQRPHPLAALTAWP